MTLSLWPINKSPFIFSFVYFIKFWPRQLFQFFYVSRTNFHCIWASPEYSSKARWIKGRNNYAFGYRISIKNYLHQVHSSNIYDRICTFLKMRRGKNHDWSMLRPKKANKRQLAASNCYWKIPSNHSETLRNRQISYDSLVHRPSLKVSKYSDFFRQSLSQISINHFMLRDLSLRIKQ